MTVLVQEDFIHLNAEVVIIAGGYNAKLQPLDVGLNKPFKTVYQQQSKQWLLTQPEGSCPHCKDASQWATESWDQITIWSITKT
jgi:DDE superfamily endonuclease